MGAGETSQIGRGAAVRVSIVATGVRTKLSGGGKTMELDGLARTSERTLWGGVSPRNVGAYHNDGGFVSRYVYWTLLIAFHCGLARLVAAESAAHVSLLQRHRLHLSLARFLFPLVYEALYRHLLCRIPYQFDHYQYILRLNQQPVQVGSAHRPQKGHRDRRLFFSHISCSSVTTKLATSLER